jgi:hypothetical protein
MLSVLCAYRKLLLVAQVQAQQDALEARSLPDQDQFTVVCERDGLPAADTAVGQAVRVDKEEAMAVSNTGTSHASPAALQRLLHQRQRVSPLHSHAFKMKIKLVFVA